MSASTASGAGDCCGSGCRSRRCSGTWHSLGWGWTAPLTSERTYFRQGINPWRTLEQTIAGAAGGLGAIGHGYKVLEPQNGGVFLPGVEDLILLVVLAIACWALVRTWRELPAPYFVYALLVLAMCISSPVRSDPLRSLDRYILTIFPLWMAAGAWVSRVRGLRTVLLLGALLMAFYSYEFATWAFVA